jgi:shikimate kinase
VLIGFMCSGKSKVGQLVAKKMGWAHYDTDEMITKDVGARPGDIIRTQGEPAFRQLEEKVVGLVSLLDRCVISTGGGVPLNRANMAQLTAGAAKVIWLRVSPETVIKRAGNLKSRPLIDAARPLESVRERLNEREPFYAAAAHTLDTDEQTPQQLADAIVSLLPGSV